MPRAAAYDGPHPFRKDIIVKAQDILPDGQNEVERNGVVIRKGSVGAFLANARVWCDPASAAVARAEAERDIVDALPVLRELGLFDVLSIRDARLRDLVDAQGWSAASLE